MKILIIAGKIQLGGFSKSLLYLLDCLQKYDVKVDLFLTKDSTSSWMKCIPKAVNIIENDLTHELRKNEDVHIKKILAIILSGRWFYQLKFKFIKHIKYKNGSVPQNLVMKYAEINDKMRVKYLKSKCDFYDDYDCVVSWEEWFCNYILASKFKAKRKIGYIHPDYLGAKFDKETDLPFLSKLDNVAVISTASNLSLCEAIPEIAHKVITIPNVISISQVRDFAKENTDYALSGAFIILTVCRLQNISKALERAVMISAMLRDNGLNFKWYVIGDGEDREKLLQLVKEYELEDVFILLGSSENPYPYMKMADLFVLQSYYEGRPLVVDEAMIVGTPVLVTNYHSSVEQVADNVYGYIVNNEQEDIYLKLRDIIDKPEQLNVLRDNLVKRNWDELEDCSTFLSATKGRIV